MSIYLNAEHSAQVLGGLMQAIFCIFLARKEEMLTKVHGVYDIHRLLIVDETCAFNMWDIIDCVERRMLSKTVIPLCPDFTLEKRIIESAVKRYFQ